MTRTLSHNIIEKEYCRSAFTLPCHQHFGFIIRGKHATVLMGVHFVSVWRRGGGVCVWCKSSVWGRFRRLWVPADTAVRGWGTDSPGVPGSSSIEVSDWLTGEVVLPVGLSQCQRFVREAQKAQMYLQYVCQSDHYNEILFFFREAPVPTCSTYVWWTSEIYPELFNTNVTSNTEWWSFPNFPLTDAC